MEFLIFDGHHPKNISFFLDVARPECMVAELLQRLGLQLPEPSRIAENTVANVMPKKGALNA